LKERPSNCTFSIHTTSPKVKFEELGVIEYWDRWHGGGASDLEKVKTTSQEWVCKAGGNGLLLWEASGSSYPKATVIYIEK
jgi:hypothetical protein